MSKYNDVNALVYDSIQECIEMAKMCIETTKSGGGCYGMPALILLCAAIDAMGSFYDESGNYQHLKEDFKGMGNGCHYKEFYNAFVGVLASEISEDDFCSGKHSVVCYRHNSIHNSGLFKNCLISNNGEKLLEKKKDSEDWTLNIVRMWQIVEKCYEKLKEEHPFVSESEEELVSMLEECTVITGVTANNNSQITGHT